MNRKSPPKAKKPMPKMSQKRLEEFGALGVRPASTFDKPGVKKTPPKTKRYKDTGPDPETVERVRARDRYVCVCCGDPCPGRRGFEWSISHRKLRAQGVDNRMSNLMLSCGNGAWGCEAEYHRGPERARQAGWMLKSTEDPAAMPLEHSQFGRVLLDDEGGWVKYEEASA